MSDDVILGEPADEATQRAIRLHRQGHVEQAAALYRSILETNPQHVDALHFLGVAEHQRGRAEQGLALIDRALALAPRHPDLHNNRGNVLKFLGRLDEAQRSFGEALELAPDDPNALNNLGCVLRERGNLAGAVELFRKVTTLQPDHVDAYQNLGNSLGGLGRLDEGLDALRHALVLRPGAATAYRHLGAMLYARGRIAEAADVYRHWLARTPDDPEPQHLIAACTQTKVPACAPKEFVRGLFDRFAPSFDSSLARLEYRAPSLVIEGIEACIGAPRAELDVLDAGCGTGLCAAGLRPFARQLVGVDLSSGMLERARSRASYDLLVESDLTEHLEGHPASYDLIASADTLVYFGALDDICAAAGRSLRAGGLFVFTTERSAESVAPAGFLLHPHGRYSHTQSYLRRVLSEATIDILSMQEVEPRREVGTWVPGWLVVARKR